MLKRLSPTLPSQSHSSKSFHSYPYGSNLQGYDSSFAPLGLASRPYSASTGQSYPESPQTLYKMYINSSTWPWKLSTTRANILPQSHFHSQTQVPFALQMDDALFQEHLPTAILAAFKGQLPKFLTCSNKLSFLWNSSLLLTSLVLFTLLYFLSPSFMGLSQPTEQRGPAIGIPTFYKLL